MDYINLWFKIKVYFIIGILALIALLLIYTVLSLLIKEQILKINGFKYDKGLGLNVAVEYQSKFTKGKYSIRFKETDHMSIIELIRKIKEINTKIKKGIE